MRVQRVMAPAAAVTLMRADNTEHLQKAAAARSERTRVSDASWQRHIELATRSS